MNEDHQLPAARLPTDARYWNGLAVRIVARATPLLEDYRVAKESWWMPLARQSPWLAAAAAVIVVTGWLVMASGSSGEADLLRALTPSEPFARAILAADGPPSLDRLLVQVRGVAP